MDYENYPLFDNDLKELSKLLLNLKQLKVLKIGLDTSYFTEESMKYLMNGLKYFTKLRSLTINMYENISNSGILDLNF